MTRRVQSGWLFSPKRRKKIRKLNDQAIPLNFLYVSISVEDEDEIPDRVRKKLKRAFEEVLEEEGITYF